MLYYKSLYSKIAYVNHVPCQSTHVLVANVILVHQSSKQEDKLILNPQNDTYTGRLLWLVWIVSLQKWTTPESTWQQSKTTPLRWTRAVIWSTPKFESSSHTTQINCTKRETLQGLGWCEPAFIQWHWLDEQSVLIKAHQGSRQLQDALCCYWVSLMKHKILRS